MQAYLHSLKIHGDSGTGTRERHVLGDVDRIDKIDGDNTYVAVIGEKRYSAIYNPFVGAYFVDDVYGELS
jgi:hypothetical protein